MPDYMMNMSYNNPFLMNGTMNPYMSMDNSSFNSAWNNIGMLGNNYYMPFNQSLFTQPTFSSASSTAPSAASSSSSSAANDKNKELKLTDKEKRALAMAAAKLNNAVGGAGTAVMSAAGFAAFELAKPAFSARRTYNGIQNTKNALKGVNQEFYKQNFDLMDEARQTLVDTEKRLSKKHGLWRKALPDNQRNQLIKYRDQLVREMNKKKPNLQQIAKENERLKVASSVKNGCLVRESKRLTPDKAVMQNQKSILTSAKRAVDTTSKGTIARLGGKALKTFKGFAIFEGVIETVTKIIPAFTSGGAKSGFKQMGESAVRITATTGAYAIGHAAGAWAGAKLGAAVGAAGGPLGAIIGGAVGIIVGCFASWGAEKGINKLFKGVEENDRLEAVQNAKDPKQLEANLMVIEKAMQEGKEVPPDAKAVYEKVIKYLEANPNASALFEATA